jgi:SSS family solute:Na+ symporter
MLDIAIIIIYFILTLWVGIRSAKKIHGIDEFSIGNRNFSVTVLVATLSGTLIGGGTTLGLAEKTFSVGLIFLAAYSGILIERILTSTLIADKMEPFFGLITAGDIMEKIYGKTAKILTGIGTVTTSIFILGAHITTMGFILKSFLGMPLPLSLGLSTLSMLIYSGYGGIAAVSFTDVVQFGFMLVSIPLVALISLMDIGGFAQIVAKVPKSHLYLNELNNQAIWQHSVIFLSYALPALYPVIVQRMLMAKNTRQIKISLWLNSFLSIFFYSMMALIGLIAFVKNPQLDPKQAFPTLIMHSLPDGIKGLVIVGLIATIMSTVDSFLNLISVSFTHDVLQPLTGSRFSSKQQLKIARFITVFIGVAGLISALYFNGILENVFASMNLWLPFIFPPLFFGIRWNWGTAKSFLSGIIVAAVILLLARIFGLSEGFFPTLLAAAGNSVVLFFAFALSKNRIRKPKYAIRLVTLGRQITTGFYNFRNEIGKNIDSNVSISDVLSIFILSFTTLPIIASAGTGAKPGVINIVLSFSMAIIAVLFILKDLWIRKPSWRFLSRQLPLFIAVSQLTQPLVNLYANNFSSLSILNVLIGIALLWILQPGISGIFWGSSASLLALSLAYFYNPISGSYGTMPQALEVTIRFLALLYFVLHFQRQDRNRLETFNSMTGILAHEVGHSIISMNLCAHRLRASLPILLEAYRANEKIYERNAINQSDLSALEELSDRLNENARRTKSAVQIIQTKIDADISPPLTESTPIRALIQEALRSGIKESINPQTVITISGDDFCITAEKGSMVHVFINIIKNALEALHGHIQPKIEIKLNPDLKSVAVIDNGDGIDKKHLKNIFDENFTTKKHGHGKGLHFCKMILEEFGASISCQSTLNNTEFLIHFNNIAKEKAA